MAFPLVAAGFALANMLGSGGQAALQARWARKQYERERADSLEFWNMQNEYNSPQQQMARLKEAGLNPHLVYGTGAVANSAQQPRNPEMKNVPMPNLGAAATQGIEQYVNFQNRELVNDNLLEQKKVMQQEQLLKAAQVYKTLNEGDSKAWFLDKDRTLFPYQLEAAKTNIEATLADIERDKATTESTVVNTQIKLNKEERDAAMFSPSLEQAVLKVALMRSQLITDVAKRREIEQRISSMRTNEEFAKKLKGYEVMLNANGVQKNDALWERILARLIGEVMGDQPPKVETSEDYKRMLENAPSRR